MVVRYCKTCKIRKFNGKYMSLREVSKVVMEKRWQSQFSFGDFVQVKQTIQLEIGMFELHMLNNKCLVGGDEDRTWKIFSSDMMSDNNSATKKRKYDNYYERVPQLSIAQQHTTQVPPTCTFEQVGEQMLIVPKIFVVVGDIFNQSKAFWRNEQREHKGEGAIVYIVEVNPSSDGFVLNINDDSEFSDNTSTEDTTEW